MPSQTPLPPDLPLQALRHFLLVAELGSFSAAAERAFRTQPAISLSVSELENRLGKPLFEPGRRVKLTAFGQACLPLVRELIEHHARVADIIGRLASNNAGAVAIAAIAAAATHWLPAVVRKFHTKHPDVRITLLDDNSSNVERMILSGQADFGICSPISNDRRLAFEPLTNDVFGVVCRRDHALTQHPQLRWRDLADVPLIGTVAHRQLDGHPQAAMLAEPPIFVANFLSLLAMVRHGDGVTVLPELGVPPSATDLAFIPLVSPRIVRKIGLMRPTDRTMSPAADAIAEMLRQRARGSGATALESAPAPRRRAATKQ